jgi:hypothetical protein
MDNPPAIKAADSSHNITDGDMVAIHQQFEEEAKSDVALSQTLEASAPAATTGAAATIGTAVAVSHDALTVAVTEPDIAMGMVRTTSKVIDARIETRQYKFCHDMSQYDYIWFLKFVSKEHPCMALQEDGEALPIPAWATSEKELTKKVRYYPHLNMSYLSYRY